MNTKIIRLKYVFTAIFFCLICGNVWGEEFSQINLQTVLSFSNFNKVGSDYNGTIQGPFPASDGNSYSGWSKVGCMYNSGGTKTVLQMRSGDGKLTSPIIISNTGFTIKITYSSKQALNVSINSDKASGTTASSAKTDGTGCEVSLTTTSTNCTFVLNDGKAVMYVSKIELTPNSTSSVTAPTISPKSGNFEGSQEVTITPTEGTTVYYTINENEPDNTSTLYTEPFIITKTTTVKTIAYKDKEASDVVSATYTKVLPAPDFSFDTKDITINLGETFTAPTLTNTSDGAVTYTSSNIDLANVSGNGTVTLKDGVSGTATITASVTETETYASASDSYTLTVIDPNNQTIVLDFVNDDWGFPVDDGDGSATFNNLTCTFKKAKKATNANYLYIKALGELTLPVFTDKIVTSIKLTTSNTIGSTVKISLYAGTNVIVSNKAIGTKNETFIFDIPSNFQGANIAYKFTPTTGNMQTIKIEMDCKQIEASFTIDPLTKAMNLIGAWTADGINALDLSEITSIDMTSIDIKAGTTLNNSMNPNCLAYASYKYIDNIEAIPNAILLDENSSDAFNTIQLKDGYDFHNTKPFSGTVTYTRNFLAGWNTFALPFDADIAAGDDIEAFDRKEGNTIVFKKATTIAANTPYLINITIAGEKTFTAKNDIPVTASTGDTYKSNFSKLENDAIAGKYILVLEGDKEVFAPAATGAELPAFRGYLELPQASGVRYSISHDKSGPTNIDSNHIEGLSIHIENGMLNIHTDAAQTVLIRCIDGRTIQNIRLAEDTETQINNLPKGIYLVNNQKVIIK